MAVRARSGAAPDQPVTTGSDTLVVQDIENLLSVWFESRRVNTLVMRPDRYVAILCDDAELESRSNEFLTRFGNAVAI